jgi:hypothetical protein
MYVVKMGLRLYIFLHSLATSRSIKIGVLLCDNSIRYVGTCVIYAIYMFDHDKMIKKI